MAKSPKSMSLDNPDWPGNSREYLMWAYERSKEVQRHYDETLLSLRKRASVAAISHWAVLGWLIAGPLGPRLLGLEGCLRGGMLAGAFASGLLMILTVVPRTMQVITIDGLIGETALKNPVVASLLAAIRQIDDCAAVQRIQANRCADLTKWCQYVSAVGIFSALLLAFYA